MNTDKINQDLSDNELESQAKQIADLLDEHAQRLSMRTLKQLENGRERALKAHNYGAVARHHGNVIAGIFSWAEHHRVASTGMILGAMVVGFILMQSLNHKESSDAFILGADLPPEAFVDRGFEPFLNDGKAKL